MTRPRAHIWIISALLCWAAVLPSARAQQPNNAASPPSAPAWQINIAPYLWLPTVNASLSYSLPRGLGGRLPTDVSSGPGEYLSHLDFAGMLSADVRNGPYSLLTDFMYTRFSLGRTNIRSLDFFGSPSIPIARSLQTSIGSTLRATIWTLAGGYTVAQGPWGNFDVLLGVRLLNVNAYTSYDLAFSVQGPRGNGGTFGRSGSVNGSSAIWNGIVGVRGRIRLADTHLFIPYYFDIGGGGSQPTWQIASGLGYQADWGAISATYRYLSFRQSGDVLVTHMSLAGPMLMADFTF